MTSFGTPLSLDLFPDPAWTATTAADVGAGPYPGNRPVGSWLLRGDGTLRVLRPSGDLWTTSDGEQVDVRGRRLVVGFGSNPNPAKLLEHQGLFDDGDVIALRAATLGWAAVWCDGRRRTDGSVVATFVPVPGRVEVHPVFAYTERQLDIVDHWEGHPTRYRRVPHDGPVLLESGVRTTEVEVYLGNDAAREPLLVDGAPLLCADVGHAEVDRMVAPLD